MNLGYFWKSLPKFLFYQINPSIYRIDSVIFLRSPLNYNYTIFQKEKKSKIKIQ
jgi:hypothetical protein